MSDKDTTKKVNGRLGKVVDPKEAFYTVFEPRTPNRFMVHIKDEKGNVLIPHFLIKYIDRPRYVLSSDRKRIWQPVRIRVYEPIVPTNVYFKMLSAGVFNVIVEELGPVADVVGCWSLPLCRFESLNPKPLDWSSSGEPLEVWAELNWTDLIVQDGDSEFRISRR